MGLWAELDCAVPPRNAAHRLVAAIVATRPGARVGAVALPAVDAAVRRITSGRTTATERLAALPTITLVTTGARTRARRSSSLLAIPHGEDLAVIGSNFGGARTPGWVHNLRADPRASVVHGHREVPALASLVRGEEAEQVWATASSLYVGYAQYRQRAAHREITVWVLRLGAGTAPSA